MSKSENQTVTEKLADLEKLTKYFEQEEIDIDEGIKKFEDGMKIVGEIRGKLKSYELKIREIKDKYDI